MLEEPTSLRIDDPGVRALLLDPARYTGLCRHFAERGAAMARATAATLSR